MWGGGGAGLRFSDILFTRSRYESGMATLLTYMLKLSDGDFGYM